ncbi:alkaline phosphatase family protein [Fluviicola chungangensis]|uniref:Sulfatase-like hydrolase/transferase n=1 Tax=Fluviicola chungangensis TaxID=2597671 RepID=A0A556N7U0_9FLAO|nr:alkaline phosphatase family protein [Fluviicola chungangensis]TSJ48089.1 sulfatase-like hydrolase/transferase [Fluviicola chungangensis]
MSGTKNQKKVLLLGWDAADWKFINPLLDQGEMPALATLVEKGVMGNIQTLDPPLSPILWTSIATGKYGDEHGILSFQEPHPTTGERRPISSHSRNCRAIWNILHHEGLKTHVCGWWPSYPCEPINGIMVSNHFTDFTKEDNESNWALNEIHVNPKSELENLKDLRIHPSELTWAHLGPFLPKATQEQLDNPKYENLLKQIPLLLARCSSFHNVATEILEKKEWNFLGLYLDAIDRASHEFMKYHPPRQAHVAEDEYELFSEVMKGFYRYHDMMLDRLLHLVDEDTYIILLSDHGFYSDHRRLLQLPKDSMAPAYEHSPFGIVCLSGPGIKKDEQIYGSGLLDITPTILHLFGLPVARDMSGKVLVQAFEKPQEIKYIDSYETDREGDWGELDPNDKDDVWAAQESLEQLIALGYVEPLGENADLQKRQMQFEFKYHSARIKYSKGALQEAIVLFNELLELTPRNGKILIRLLNTYVSLKEIEGAKSILKRMREIFGYKNTPYINILESKIHMLDLNPKKALELLNSLNDSEMETPEAYVLQGKTYLMLREWKKANKSFNKAVQLNNEDADAYHGLCLTYLRMKSYQKAIESGISAIGIKFWFPVAHYHLGEALLAAKEYEHAANAFEMALQQEPGYSIARKHLVQIYTNYLNKPELAKRHQEILNKNMKPKITIVSGLPRSGTSMMMQMLKAGGADILTDNIRQSDENNPKGYLEYEPVKSLLKDNSWLKDQNGKTIKVIMQLLGNLDLNCDYKIIFMERDLDEVMQSQQKMLGKPVDTYNAKLKTTFEQQKEKNRAWLEAQPHMDVLFVNYSDVIENPSAEAERVNIFLENKLDVAQMVASVDSELYRNRKDKAIS